MSQYCKFYKQKKQVSYDSGATWQDVAPAEYQKGDLYDPYSVDCGARILERWVNNGTICSGATGFDKYYYQVKQESYDNGVNWATTTDYRLGELIEANSPDCLYNPPSFNGKWIGYYKYGNVFSQGCEENNTWPPTVELSYENVHDDSPFNRSELSSVTIGDCVDIMVDSFVGCGSLIDVHIGSGVTLLNGTGRGGGQGVFTDCDSLKRVNSNVDGVANIPSGITYIGEHCFDSCYSLTTINIPNSVTKIGGAAFSGCKNLTGITIPNSVTELGYSAFYSCTNLSSATLSESITVIEPQTFYNCGKLTGITIPNSVTEIGGKAFERCSGMTYVNFGSGVTKIRGFGRCYSLTSITIPDGVTEIGGDAFYQCSGLISVTIGSGVKEIGESAFSGCVSLESITVLPSIPPTLSGSGLSHVFDNTNNCPIYVPCNTINTYKATAGWSMYASRIVEIPNSCTFQGKFKATYTGGTTYSAECDSLTELTTATTKPSGYQYSAMTEAVIGDCNTSIGDNAFNYCTSLTSIVIPSGVTRIGSTAFNNCTGLTSINIPSGVTSIGQYTFLNCRSLTSIDIPNSVTTIGTQTFSGCRSLTSCTIGSGVTSIGNGAFLNCSGLTSITVNATTPPTLGSSVFSSTPIAGGTGYIYVPSASVDVYKSADGWRTYADRIQAIP